MPRLTSTVLRLPEVSVKTRVTEAPGVLDCTVATKALPLSMTWSSILVTTSPGVSPAVAAGLPGVDVDDPGTPA